MVCDKCELKLKRVITPDVLKAPMGKAPMTSKFEEEKRP